MTRKIDRSVGSLNLTLTALPYWLSACAALFVLQASLILTHEPWLDEFQAVQIAVQAPDIETLLEWLRYEGHPPLFYLILRALAHLVSPLQTLPVFALCCAIVAQAVILFRSPFGRAERLLIGSSEFVLFEFLTLARSMTLGVTLLIVIMAIWRSRFVWIAIALLPMCDFLYGILSGVLVMLKWREGGRWWPGASLWLAVGLLATWAVFPAEDVMPALTLSGLLPDFVQYATSLGTLLFPLQGGVLPAWNTPVWPLAGILWIGFLWFGWIQTARDPFHRLLLFGFIGFTFVFSMLVYPLAIRHLMLIALLLILLTWHGRDAGQQSRPGFRLWLVAISLCGLATAAINLAMPFDTASRAVAEIRRLNLADKHWMVFPDSRAQGVAALSGIDFERTQQHCMQSFIRWNYRTDLLTPQRMEIYLREEVARHGRFYLLSDLDMAALPTSLLEPLAEIQPGYNGQTFHLYVVGPEAAERQVHLPPCVPDRRPFTSL